MPGDRHASGRSSAPVVDISWLIATYHRDLYGYAFRLSGSASDAEDLVQQTFLFAHQKCHQIRSQQSARGWLYTVLRNCFLKDRRRRRPELAENIDVQLDQLGDEIPDALWVDQEQLQSAINELPDPFKLVLVMFYYEECSYREIADQLGIAEGTVMSRLSRAKKRLRQRLSGDGQAAAASGRSLPEF